MTPLLTVAGVDVSFRAAGRPPTHAVIDATLNVDPGTTVALVGESGSGKTTLARTILGLQRRDRGDITLFGTSLPEDPRRVPTTLRRKLQPLFQDPGASLDPMWRMGDLLREAMLVTQSVAPTHYDAEIDRWFVALGLEKDLLARRPHELSGGQQQRMALARVLITGARFLVLDEPLTALDPPSQRAATELLLQLKRQHGVASLLVSHDLALVRTLADSVVVMYRGRIVESGPTHVVLGAPRHPYTRLLLASVLPADPDLARQRLATLPEDHVTELPPLGCAFAPRCPHVIPACRESTPPLIAEADAPNHIFACPVRI